MRNAMLEVSVNNALSRCVLAATCTWLQPKNRHSPLLLPRGLACLLHVEQILLSELSSEAWETRGHTPTLSTLLCVQYTQRMHWAGVAAGRQCEAQRAQPCACKLCR